MLKRKRGRPRKNPNPNPNRNPQPVMLETPVQENPLPVNPDPEPANPQSASAGLNAELVSDNFEAVASQIPAVIDGGTSGAAVPVAGDVQPGAQPVACESEFFSAFSSAEQVKHWIDIPFKMLAGALKNPDAELQPYEREMFAPAVAAVGQKYLPDLLRKTDKPELAMLAMACTAYAVRVGLSTWEKQETEQAKQQQEKTQSFGKPVSLAGVSTITDSAASPVSSDNPAPGKVF